MAKKITTSDLQKKLNTLSLSEILTMLNAYSVVTGIDIDSVKEYIPTAPYLISIPNTGLFLAVLRYILWF